MCFCPLACEFRWGQVFILDALSKYKAADAREAENIVERVTPRLQHANCAVVLSAVKVKLDYVDTDNDIPSHLPLFDSYASYTLHCPSKFIPTSR